MPRRRTYTLARAAEKLGKNRNLAAFLVRDRQIPVRIEGPCKVLDEDGLRALARAFDDYEAKPVAAAN